MDYFLNLWRNEPALVVGFVTAVLDLLIAFGLPISADQKLAIVGVVDALLALLGAAVVRSQVTPAAHLPVVPVKP